MDLCVYSKYQASMKIPNDILSGLFCSPIFVTHMQRTTTENAVIRAHLASRSEFHVVMSGTISAKNNVRSVFTFSCLEQESCLIYVICVCLAIAVSNKYCVVFLFCFSSSCVTCAVSFSGLSNFDCHFGILYHLLTRKYLS